MMDIEDACAERKSRRNECPLDAQEREKRKRLVDNARELCEYGAWVRGELRQKERGSL